MEVDPQATTSVGAWPTVYVGSFIGVDHLVACPACAALIADDENHRAGHLAWHTRNDGEAHDGCLLDIMSEEAIPRKHGEEMIWAIAKRRCTRAFGRGPCELCLSTVASIIRNMEDMGYGVRRLVIPAHSDGSECG